MDIQGLVVIILSLLLLVGIMIFFVWVALYFGGRLIRQHLYWDDFVKVVAELKSVSFFQDDGLRWATLYVRYIWDGEMINTEFDVRESTGMHVQKFK